MRCKVGDLALVVRSFAGNEGKVVTCVKYVGRNPGIMEWNGEKLFLSSEVDWWQVDRNMNMLMVGISGDREIHPDHSPFCRDDFMIPIGNKDVPLEVTEDEKIQGTVPVH